MAKVRRNFWVECKWPGLVSYTREFNFGPQRIEDGFKIKIHQRDNDGNGFVAFKITGISEEVSSNRRRLLIEIEDENRNLVSLGRGTIRKHRPRPTF